MRIGERSMVTNQVICPVNRKIIQNLSRLFPITPPNTTSVVGYPWYSFRDTYIYIYIYSHSCPHAIFG